MDDGVHGVFKGAETDDFERNIEVSGVNLFKQLFVVIGLIYYYKIGFILSFDEVGD